MKSPNPCCHGCDGTGLMIYLCGHCGGRGERFSAGAERGWINCTLCNGRGAYDVVCDCCVTYKEASDDAQEEV